MDEDLLMSMLSDIQSELSSIRSEVSGIRLWIPDTKNIERKLDRIIELLESNHRR